MRTPRLRAGLIGLGRMGRHHARILRDLPGVDLVGVVDPAGDPYHAAEGITLLPDLDALVCHGIDYAVLACPTPLHDPLGTALATARIPTLIENPSPPTPPRRTGSRRPSIMPASPRPWATSNDSTQL